MLKKFILFFSILGLSAPSLYTQWIQTYSKDPMCFDISSPDSTDCLIYVFEQGFLKVIGSTDQGKTWEEVHNEAFYEIGDPWPNPTKAEELVYPAKGYVYIGYEKGAMKISHDRCKTFDTVYFPVYPEGSPIWAISMADSIVGLAGSTASIFLTTNGFKDYKVIKVPLEDSLYIRDVYIKDSNNFAFVSSYWFTNEKGPRYFRTEDGGETWQKQRLDTMAGGVHDIFFYNASIGWLAGYTPNGVGQQKYDVLYKTEDGGKNWKLVYRKENIKKWGLSEIKFSDSLNGIATGQYGKILRTTDGGDNWQQEYYTTTPQNDQPLFMSLGYIGKKPIIGVENSGLIMRLEDVSVNNHFPNNNPHFLFPNPASTSTTLKLTEELNGRITAVDLLGNETLVWSGYAPAGDLELDVSHLPTGIYTILINNGYKTEALKMIKE